MALAIELNGCFPYVIVLCRDIGSEREIANRGRPLGERK